MIGISADFDPLHKGHVQLIEKGREIAEKTGEKLIVYLNKDYSANHAPFFTPYDAREKMALKAGADEIIPIEGLHYRLTLSYTVPIRIAMMIEDGVTDYVDAANVPPHFIKKEAEYFAKRGIFSGIPSNLPNRNVIRWFAVNEFFQGKYKRKMKFHIIPELTENGSKISGREIRKKIIENNLEIPEDVAKLLPETTIKILEKELKRGRAPGKRNLELIKDKMNRLSRADLLEIAYLNANLINSIIKWRPYHTENQIWATFRKAGYGPVLTRLAMSSMEMNVTRREVYDLIGHYEKKGWIPPDQERRKIIQRAWFISKSIKKGHTSKEAHKRFLKGHIPSEEPERSLNAGLSLRKFETRKLREGTKAKIYVKEDDVISCQIKDGMKIKSPLILPGAMATYLRLIIDSHFIPFNGRLIKKDESFRIQINIG